jgi:hypothetical protein
MTYEPAYDDPSIDPFAQTASTDDLFFDDDITPIAEPVVEQNPLEAEVIDAEYLPENTQPPSAPQAHLAPHIPQGPRAERGGRGRGRGRGARRGRGGGGNVGDIRELDKKAQEKEVKDAKPEPAPAPAEPAADSTPASAETEAAGTPDAPTEPKEKPTHSVRGDRRLTGGPARTRLTEDQLNAKPSKPHTRAPKPISPTSKPAKPSSRKKTSSAKRC